MISALPCPYFIPPRTCHADSGGVDEAHARECCHPGYARGRCHRFPADSIADSVRCIVSKDEGGVIEVRWGRELNHEPVDAGVLRYPAEKLADAAMQSQAEAVAEAYLTRKAKWRKN